MSKLSGIATVAAIAGFAALGNVPSADAAFKLMLSDGVNTVTIADGDAADANGTVGTPNGVITFNGSLSNNGGMGGGGVSKWTVNVTTGISKPVLGGPNVAEMDLNSVNVTTTGAGMLNIKLTDTDFTLPAGGYSLHSSIGGTTSGLVTYWEYLDKANNEFGIPGSVSNHLGPFGPGAFSGSKTSAGVVIGGAFSMTEWVKIVHTGSGVTSFDANSKVPAPAALVLGSIGLGIVGWIKRRMA